MTIGVSTMQRVISNQINVAFVWCASPITIDKRAEWGGEESFQNAPNGAFLKMSSPTEVSHLVQPNSDKTAPEGWVPGDAPGFFNKSPIWITNVVIPPNTKTLVDTLDGTIECEFAEPSMLCYNGDENGPNEKDGWVQTMKNLRKNYILD